MKKLRISLVNISPDGVVWRTIRKGHIIRGSFPSKLSKSENGNFELPESGTFKSSLVYESPFIEICGFYNSLPKLEPTFQRLVKSEFALKFAGIVLINPTVAVQLTGYGRKIHLGEKIFLKDSVLKWGAGDVITCEWPTVLTDSEFMEIQSVAFTP